MLLILALVKQEFRLKLTLDIVRKEYLNIKLHQGMYQERVYQIMIYWVLPDTTYSFGTSYSKRGHEEGVGTFACFMFTKNN